MTTRPAVFAARGWYPSAPAACRERIEEYLSGADRLLEGVALPDRPVAGLVPHAGWAYSGPTAAAVFAALARSRSPEVVVLLSAVHVRGVARPTAWAGDAWETPLGPIAVRSDLFDGIACDRATAPHLGEHSIEVQLPFVGHLWPQAAIAVLMVPPTAEAARVGPALAGRLAGGSIDGIVIGTTDMTHYGPRYGFAPRGVGDEAHRWVVEENDPPMLDAIGRLAVEEIADQAARHHNACSVGPIEAVLSYARAAGSRGGTLLDYTTSQERFPDRPADDFVGYAGFVF